MDVVEQNDQENDEQEDGLSEEDFDDALYKATRKLEDEDEGEKSAE